MLGVRMFALISLGLKLDRGPFLVSAERTPVFRHKRDNLAYVTTTDNQVKVCYLEKKINCHKISVTLQYFLSLYFKI